MKRPSVHQTGFQISDSGEVQMIMGREHIQNCIRMAVLTNKGEIRHRPSDGSSLREILYRRKESSLLREIKNDLKKNLQSIEDRIQIRDILIERGETDQKTVQIQVRYHYPHLGTEETMMITMGEHLC